MFRTKKTVAKINSKFYDLINDYEEVITQSEQEAADLSIQIDLLCEQQVAALKEADSASKFQSKIKAFLED